MLKIREDNLRINKITKSKPADTTSASATSSEPPAAQESTTANYEIICPYCQARFGINNVKFRAENPASSDIDPTNPYIATEHAEFGELWKEKMHWGESANMQEFSDYYSWVKNPNERINGVPVGRVKFCLLSDSLIKTRHSNDRGIITSVTDKRGIETKKRVCPDCLSVLPENYGFNKTYFFSIVGIKGSGKTVYLSKFFNEVRNQLEPFGLNITGESMDVFCKERNVQTGSPVPSGTPKEYIHPPVFMNVTTDLQEQYTFVFYDIAGENCVTKEGIKNFGKFIEISDGLIVLIPPGLIPGLVDESEDDASVEGQQITAVLDSVATNYAQPYIENKCRCPLKLAVTIPKSDLFRDTKYNGFVLEEISPSLFNNIDHEKDTGFKIAESDKTEGSVLRILKSTPLITTISNNYENVRYFALSALGEKPKEEVRDGVPVKIVAEGEPIHLSEPFLWMLSELKIIPKIK